MRFLIPLLLLSAATPALADPGDQDHRDARAARVEQRQEQRQERAERPQPRFERPAPAAPQVQRVDAPAPQFDRSQRRFDGGRPADPNGGQRWQGRGGQQPQPPVFNGAPGQPTPNNVADWRSRDRRGGDRPNATAPSPVVRIDGGTYGYRDGRDPNRDGRWQGRDGRDGRNNGTWTGRDGRYNGTWTGRDGRNGGNWSRDWRRDPRYDWQRYRNANRSIFRIGAYIDPFGWGYQQIGIGYQLYPNYYSDQYWLSDPSYYSLPPVSWPYRWVRYYDDALLIDVRDGRVVDAIQSFFW
ncbi:MULTISPECIES: RcnB family protein [Sphingomonas]|uniref:RcnB family protein n=1 Tax=Sphingomonas TaxID=13687 RepID=UPI000DEED338|nr:MULTISPECIES: RcnB family protein [Sphingomonas]